MPAVIQDEATAPPTEVVHEYTELPFPPITKQHILNCSYHSWHPRYRAVTPKARLIPLTPPFLAYLRADGIILPDDETDRPFNPQDDDSGIFSASDNNDADDDEDSDNDEDVSEPWAAVHQEIKEVIAELGGKVVPKLNWSAPKDATWMNATNSMECRTPNDIYLLLKSSDFITHDLEHAFDDTAESPQEAHLSSGDIPFHLVLRKSVQMNPSVEFRCFVRGRKLVGVCQRDMNHFEFLSQMEDRLRSRIQQFFDLRLRDTFPDGNFVFDAYVPAPHDRVWLIDVNPWAPRTDPLLFSWLELLTMDEPPEMKEDGEDEVVRIPLRPMPRASDENDEDTDTDDTNLPIRQGGGPQDHDLHATASAMGPVLTPTPSDSEDDDSEEEADEEIWQPELRLVGKNDPEAYSFATPQYSAHKLPKDVVDASQSGEGLRQFARDWKKILEDRRREDEVGESSGDDA